LSYARRARRHQTVATRVCQPCGGGTYAPAARWRRAHSWNRWWGAARKKGPIPHRETALLC